VQPIVPKGEGNVKPLSIAFSKALIARIDKVSRETNNSRADTIRHLLRWALDAYDKRGVTGDELNDERAAS
jgi:metal-responsive CopG/Arc/MetJ family transcriptional regulator